MPGRAIRLTHQPQPANRNPPTADSLMDRESALDRIPILPWSLRCLPKTIRRRELPLRATLRLMLQVRVRRAGGRGQG
jgi:hypothetical protein